MLSLVVAVAVGPYELSCVRKNYLQGEAKWYRTSVCPSCGPSWGQAPLLRCLGTCMNIKLYGELIVSASLTSLACFLNELRVFPRDRHPQAWAPKTLPSS